MRRITVGDARQGRGTWQGWIAAGVLLAAGWTAGLAQAAGPEGGNAPYTITRGEWFCVNLNLTQALFDSERTPPSDVRVRYLYDKTKPDVVQIKLFYGAASNPNELRRRGILATKHVQALAKLWGYDSWLKVELKEVLSADGPPGPEALIR